MCGYNPPTPHSSRKPRRDMTIAELLVESQRLNDNARQLAEQTAQLASAIQEARAIREDKDAEREIERVRRRKSN